MSRIFCRSPFYVSVAGTANDDTSVELRIWNGTGSAPTDPTYTLSKPIPSTLITSCNYNISPYVREYISHDSFLNIYNINNQSTPTNEWCNVQVKTFLNGVLDATTTYKAYDGWGLYAQDYNYDLGFALLREGTYYYHYDSAATLSTDTLKRAGSITFEATNTYDVHYTNLVSGATFTVNLSTTKVQDIYRVYPAYMADGNKVELRDGTNTVLKTYYFRPIEECRYEPVVVDYINQYGGWSRTFMFKASRESMDVVNTDYHLMQDVNYDILKGQFAVFNANGKEYIACNTGWVDEGYNDELRELMLSERILVNNKPAKIRTKNISYNKHINDKLINYSIEFDYANYVINNV